MGDTYDKKRKLSSSKGIIIILFSLLVFQIFLSYRAYVGGDIRNLAGNLIWPYFILVMIIGVLRDAIGTSEFGLATALGGSLVLIISYFLVPSITKLAFLIILFAFSVYYAYMVLFR